jgi:type II secretory pathway pseudopilin PulG
VAFADQIGVRTRGNTEEGFLLVELIAAMMILSIALLALVGAYSLGYFSIGAAAKTSSAGLLANNQLELYATLPYASIGLDATTLTSVKSTDATYSTDESALPSGASGDVTISGCGSSAQCLPVQTVTGPDHKSYKIETFIRLLANPNITTRGEKVVTVVVRNASAAGSPKVLTMQTAFDTGSPAQTPPSIANCAQIGVKCESELVDPSVVDNTTLQIVYTDDGAPRLGGGYAPTAFLNSVQQLGISMATTSGWPQNYVDNYGGSASTANQELLTITLPSGLPAGCYTVLVTISDYDGPDTDQWPWPINVDASGNVTTVSHC